MKKSIGELIDELSITNNKIWHLIDKVYDDIHTREEAKTIQDLNKYRSSLINAINEYFKDSKKDIKI